MEPEEVCASNGTLRMQGIAANQRRTAKETITYSKLRGSILRCKCSSLEEVILWGLPRTRICLLSHDLPAGNMWEFDFHKGLLTFVCKNPCADPTEDAEPMLGFLNAGWMCLSSSSCTEPPPLTLEKVYTPVLGSQAPLEFSNTLMEGSISTSLLSHPIWYSHV